MDSDSSESLNSNFQKPLSFNRLLPYADKLDDEADTAFNEIKINIAKTLSSQDFYDQLLYWLDATSTYLDLYGYRFTKDDHVLLVKLAYQILVEKELDSAVQFQAAYLINRLLKHRHLLDRADLELDWRPLYDIRHYYSDSGPLHYGFVRFPKTRRTRRLKILSPLLRKKAMVMQFLSNKRDWLSQLDDVIRHCSRFFPISAVQEIWEEFRGKICPVFFKDDPTPEALSSISVFMPVFPNLFDEINRVYMEDILDMWHKLCNHTRSEKALMQHIERFSYHFVGRINMGPHLDRLFSSLLRILGLPVGAHRAVNSQCKQEGQPDVSSYCHTIIYSIIPGETGEEVFQRLTRLFTGISSFFHPSNTGHYTTKMNQLLKSLSMSFYNRIVRERHPVRPSLPCFGEIPQEARLTDQHIETFVKLLVPHAKMTVIRQSRNYEPLRYLALLRPDIVVPEFLEQLEESIAGGELDPQRCNAAIAVMSNLHLPMLESGYGLYPEGRLKVFGLIRSLLPCINVNDPNKFYHVFNCIGNLVLCMRVEDISNSASDSNLTTLEKDVAMATSHFEDIFLQLYDSILEVFANLSTNEDMHQERSHRTTKANEENSLFNQIGVISMKLCISNTQSIRRMILNKLINFSFENILDPRVGKELCHLIGAAYQDDLKDVALNMFLPRFIKILDELIADNHVIYKGEPDRYLLWLLSILTGLTNHRMIAFKEQWMHILRSLMAFKNSRISTIFKGMLKYTMMTMTIDSIKLCSSEIYPTDFHREDWTSLFTFKQFCGMNPTWTKCGDEHFQFVDHLIAEILEPVLKRWESYPTDYKSFELRELQCLSHWIVGFLEGGYAVMPRWEDQSVCDQLPEDAVILTLKTTKPLVVNSECKRRTVTVFGGQNIRKYIVDKGLTILDFCAQQEDAALDAEAFRSLVSCIRCACVQEKAAGKDSQGFSSWSNHISTIFKNALRKNVSGGVTWVFKMQAVHLRRFTMFTQPINTTVLRCVKSLLPFIGSQYSSQREEAINTVQAMCERYLYSTYFLVDYLLPLLDVSNNSVEEHQFQGALECIDKLCSMFEMKTSLYLINRLYVSVCQAGFSKHCNKFSIKSCYQNVLDNFLDKSYTFTLKTFTPSTKLLSFSDNLVDCFDLSEYKSRGCERTLAFLQKRCRLYNDLVVGMLKPFHRSEASLTDPNKATIPWEPLNHTIELLPLQHQVSVPPFVTEFMLNNVFHVVPLVACSSVFTLMAILWTVRYKKKRIDKPCDYFTSSTRPTPGVREDNKFLLYDRSKDILSSDEAWLSHHHITKFETGYMWWPKSVRIRDPADHPPFISTGSPMDPTHLQDEDDRRNFQLITDFLVKEETWRKLQDYMLSIYVNKRDDDGASHASSKSSDDFDENNFPLGMFFAAAFKFLGMRCVKPAEEMITRLFDEKSSKREFLQKQGIVALTGMMSGMKDWPREMILEMMTTLVPRLITHFIDLEPHHIRDYFSDNLAQLIIRQHMDISIFSPLIQHVSKLKEEYRLKYTKENLCLFFELIFAYGCAWRGCGLVNEFLKDWYHYAQHESNKLRRTASLALQIVLSSDDTMFGADPNLALVTMTDLLNNQILPLVAYHVCVVLRSKELEPSSVTLNAASRWTFSSNEGTRPAIEDAASNGSSSEDEAMDIDEEAKMVSSSQEWKCRIRSMNILQGVMNGVLAAILQNSISYPREEFWKLFVYMADLFAVQSREHLKQTIDNCFMVYSNLLVTRDNLPFVIHALNHTTNHNSWKIRVMSLNLLQQLVFNNLYTFVRADNPDLIRVYLTRLLKDEVLEVRKEAAVTLAGLVQCGYLPVDDSVMAPLYKLSRLGSKRSLDESVKLQRHSGVLGLCALVRAFPRDVPKFLPPIVMEVCQHANDPEPIRSTVRETMSSFSKTHHDTWHQHKLLFTDDQLGVLTDLLVSPSYYA